MRMFWWGVALGAAVLAAGGCIVRAQAPAVARSVFADHDAPLTLDPDAPFWRRAGVVRFDTNTMALPQPALATEVRLRWTRDALYLLFICRYRDLYLKPHPVTHAETDQLWNWDVAETFIGSDFTNIRRYKEFEVSPQGEYVDLDIDLAHPLPHGGLAWNSGFATAARIDAAARTWYGAMRIPFHAISPVPVHAGTRFRINFFRAQGAPADRALLAWSPPLGMSFHVPRHFGTLVLVR